MNTFFLALLVLLLLLAGIFAVGAAYITRHEAREREEHHSQARKRASERGDGREFYKSLGLGTGEQIKIRLFTLDEYRDELGGDPASFGGERIMGALKSYRRMDSDWYETPPEKAAAPLSLEEGDYRLDEERSVLLLKKLPPGIPPAARDLFE